MTLIFAFWQGFRGPHGQNPVAKNISIPGPLVAFGRGANLPYFGKLSDYKAYFPREEKRTILRAYQELARIPLREKEPYLGLFSL